MPEPGTRTGRTGEFTSLLPTRLAARIAEAGGDRTFVTVDGEAAVLFSDISGFTQLSEKLIGEQGAEGIDRLTGVLDEQFGRWVEIVNDLGGEVVKFAGDALLAVWFADDSGGLAQAVAAAGECALAIADSMQRQSTVDDVPLSLRVGLGAGPFTAARIGGVRGRWELVAGGAAMTQIGQTIRHATRGAVVASPDAWGLCDSLFTGTETEEGTTLTGTYDTLPPVAFMGTEPVPGGYDSTTFESYLPAVVRTHLRGGLGAFLAEHRRVSVLFIKLVDVVVEGPGWAERLHDAIAEVQTHLYSFGGALDKVSVDDKGVVVVAAFGLPSASLEYRPSAAVEAALAIEAALQGQGITTSIGLTTGKVFCGPVGSEVRREYTMIGDVVNLSARLLGAGPGITVDAATQREAADVATWTELPALRARGVRDDIACFRPAIRLGGPVEAGAGGHRLAFVGRQDELSDLIRLLRTARTAGSCVVVVEGEAGAGKSRLVMEALSALRSEGIASHVGHSLPTRQGTPYSAWSELLPRALGLPVDGTAAQRGQALQLLLAYDPERRDLLPLLSSLLDLDLPDNEHTAALTGLARGETTRALIVDLLAQRAERDAAVLVLEDAHWSDSASAELVLEVLRAKLGLTLVVTARPAGTAVDPASELRALAEHQIRLRGLSESAVEQLLRAQLAGGVSAAVVAWLVERTGGNPFFCGELIGAIRHGGASGTDLASADASALESLSIPATVEGLVVGRLDRLSPLQQLLVKTAAVIGTEFSPALLEAALPEAARSAAAAETLDPLVDAGILDRVDGGRFAMRQAIVRGIAYESLISGTRRSIHEAVARWLETSHAESLAPHFAVLAHHFSGARRLPETVRYLELAGARAIDMGTAAEGIRLFEEALALASRYAEEAAEVTTPLQRTRWVRQLARARLDLGQHAECDALVRRGLGELGFRVPTSDGAWGRLLLGQLMRQNLHRWFPTLTRRPKPVDSRLEEAAELGRVLINIAYWEYESPLVFPAASLWTLNLHERSRAVPRRSLLANAGLVLGGFGMKSASADYFHRAQTLPHSQDDQIERYYSCVGEAMHHMMAMRWAAADVGLDGMEAAARVVANDRLITQTEITRGFCRLNQGLPKAAIDLFDRGIGVAVRLGNPRDEFGGRLNRALALWDLGETDDAEAEAARATAAFALPEAELPPDVRSWKGAFAALIAVRRDDPAGVLAGAEAALTAIGPKPKFDLTYVLQLRRLGHALLTVRERAEGDPTALDAAIASTLGILAKQTGAFALARPGLLLLQGRAAAIGGNATRARKLLGKALTMAADHAMVRDEAEARAALEQLN